MGDDELKATLLDIERRGWDSLCDSTGGTFYGDLPGAGAGKATTWPVVPPTASGPAQS